jgi:hypothetical protein
MNNIQIKVLIATTAIFIVSCSIKNKLNSGLNRVFLQSQTTVSSYTRPTNINTHQRCINLGNERIRRISR